MVVYCPPGAYWSIWAAVQASISVHSFSGDLRLVSSSFQEYKFTEHGLHKTTKERPLSGGKFYQVSGSTLLILSNAHDKLQAWWGHSMTDACRTDLRQRHTDTSCSRRRSKLYGMVLCTALYSSTLCPFQTTKGHARLWILQVYKGYFETEGKFVAVKKINCLERVSPFGLLLLFWYPLAFVSCTSKSHVFQNNIRKAKYQLECDIAVALVWKAWEVGPVETGEEAASNEWHKGPVWCQPPFPGSIYWRLSHAW